MNLKHKKPNQGTYGDLFEFLKALASEVETESALNWDGGVDEDIEFSLQELYDDIYDVIMYVVQPKLYGMTYEEYAKATGKIKSEEDKEYAKKEEESDKKMILMDWDDASTRLLNCLHYNGIDSIYDIKQFINENEGLYLKNFGKKSRVELKLLLEKHGYDFALFPHD